MYKTVVFDVDGTLIDTEQAVIGSLQKLLLMNYGRTVEAGELLFVLGIPGTYSLPKLGITDIDDACAQWNVYMKEFYDSMKVFPGIMEVMGTLKTRNILQGIVTSKTDKELADDFVPFGLMDYLTHAVCANHTEKHKPNPEPLLKFLEVTGTDPASSIYIGDTIYDYECARDAGVDFGLALWGCQNHEHIPAKYKLEKPQDILKLAGE
ncbi:HAD family hydrolase [Paenibacillus sp. sgz500958]|uniref:HAD family hydrolase n=1 Tax=Paenibacillus sp. sgz500958 TaxID=3242475 RepID=UPI0036D3AD30